MYLHIWGSKPAVFTLLCTLLCTQSGSVLIWERARLRVQGSAPSLNPLAGASDEDVADDTRGAYARKTSPFAPVFQITPQSCHPPSLKLRRDRPFEVKKRKVRLACTSLYQLVLAWIRSDCNAPESGLKHEG